MKNLRKKQMQIVTLFSITNVPRRNSAIIAEAETKLILDEKYLRLMKNGKQTIGKKELQFILYDFKCDKSVDVPSRGSYVENEVTRKMRLDLAMEFIQYLESDDLKQELVIIKENVIGEIKTFIEKSIMAHIGLGVGSEIDINISDKDNSSKVKVSQNENIQISEGDDSSENPIIAHKGQKAGSKIDIDISNKDNSSEVKMSQNGNLQVSDSDGVLKKNKGKIKRK